MMSLITKHPKRFITLFVLLLLHIVVFGLTDPLNSQVIVIIGGFLLVSLDIVITTTLLVAYTTRIMPRIRSHAKRISISVAGFLIILLALSSIGQLTWRDVLAVVAIGALAYFYSVYFRIGVRRRE